MMYNEFLELSGTTESYISFNEYTSEIEPIYTGCELSKTDFINLMKEVFEKIVYPAVNKAIENAPCEQKESYVFDENPDFEKEIGQVDRAARKIAYQYMKLYTQL